MTWLAPEKALAKGLLLGFVKVVAGGGKQVVRAPTSPTSNMVSRQGYRDPLSFNAIVELIAKVHWPDRFGALCTARGGQASIKQRAVLSHRLAF